MNKFISNLLFCLFLKLLLIQNSFGYAPFPEQRKTTYDEEFEDRFQAEHIKDGDGKTYPEYYKFVRMKFKGFIPATGQVFDSSDTRGGFYEFQYRKRIRTDIKHVICWDETIYRMSKGERIIITCPADSAFQNHGLVFGSKVLVKSGETVSYEIELIEAQYDPFNITIIKKGAGIMRPKYMDLIRYKYTVWVGDDKEFPIAVVDSANIHLSGVPFDNLTDSMCKTEALRQMTVGAIAEVNCHYRYNSYGKEFPQQQVPLYPELGFRVQLLSIREMNYTLSHKLDEP